jgi:ribokinase
MARKQFDVVVLGGINSDFVVRGTLLPSPGQTVQGGSFYSGPGGKGANQAVAASRLGATVALIGCVGADNRGPALVRALKKAGIDTKFVFKRKSGQTGAAVIMVDQHGEKQIAAAPGANMALKIAEVRQARAYLENCSVLLMQFESPEKCLIQAAQIARNAGATVVLDPAPPRKIPSALKPLLDVIRPNSDEAKALTGLNVHDLSGARKAGAKLLAWGVRIAALQAGDKGDLLVTAQSELLLKRLKVKSIDATGAGDAFAAGLAVGLAEGLSLEEIGRLANATAALSTTKVGAQEALPTRAAVERLLSRSHLGKRAIKG